VGSAIGARLEERGIAARGVLQDDSADLILFELTGPIARGDRSTVEAHLAAIRAHAPDLEAMYRALAEVTTG
jgi:predicted short-subunit dehydrogenase-like oxidoreductase (DUF2520 family)